MRNRQVILIAVVVIALGSTVAFAQVSGALRSQGDRNDVTTRIIDGAPPDQQAQLADGQVTASERVAAAERTMQCLRDQGVSVELTPERGPGQFRFGGGTPAEQARANSVYQDCYARLQRETDMVYSVQQPSLDETSAASAEQALLTCLRQAGVEVELSAPKTVWWDLRLTAPTEFAKCGNAVVAEFGALP